MTGSLDYRDLCGLLGSNSVDACGMIALRSMFLDYVHRIITSIGRSIFGFDVCFFRYPARAFTILERFGYEYDGAANIDYFAEYGSGAVLLRVLYDFRDYERVDAFACYGASIYGGYFYVFGIGLVLYDA